MTMNLGNSTRDARIGLVPLNRAASGANLTMNDKELMIPDFWLVMSLKPKNPSRTIIKDIKDIIKDKACG